MSRKDEAYAYIKNLIVQNTLKPNEPINELLLSNQMQMSRTPIREAMRDLERDGLIVSYPSRGAFVTNITPSDIDEIYELRLLLEQWALERSILRIQEEDLDLVANQFAQAIAASDWELHHKTDRMLHDLIIDNAGSKRLKLFMNVLNTQIECVRNISARDKDRRERSYKEHMALIDCIRRRDLTSAQEALRLHLRSVADSAAEEIKFAG